MDSFQREKCLSNPFGLHALLRALLSLISERLNVHERVATVPFFLTRLPEVCVPNNNSVRGFDVVDRIKWEVDIACGGPVVSCADILAVAVRDSVVALGGPNWEEHFHQRTHPMDLQGLITIFSNHGLTPEDLVVLSGSHTIGFAQCSVFRNRIYNENNIDSSFAGEEQATCPLTGGDSNLAPLDPALFDTKYFDNLVMNKGLLHSDQQLFSAGSDQTDSLVQAYSSHPDAFAMDYVNSMIKAPTHWGPRPDSMQLQDGQF
ncbi:Cationic peroxidase 1 [Sesamum angolense]|uniref:peroxidase n=1 Tax=Sesamum angolense TaxID=2727404 RepID=A0AAE2BSD6_9LAMI|nr:Cationic peroxidase 1 [Sesamum angolense]